MSLSFDDAVGVHAAALKLRGERHQLLSENLANADTPHYKARDFDFATALEEAQQGQGGQLPLATTNQSHIGNGGSNSGPQADALYRVPNSPSLDGNTVETQVEQAKFAENAVKYRASLNFLGGKVTSLIGALRGE